MHHQAGGSRRELCPRTGPLRPGVLSPGPRMLRGLRWPRFEYRAKVMRSWYRALRKGRPVC